jgi:hypothetical protein
MIKTLGTHSAKERSGQALLSTIDWKKESPIKLRTPADVDHPAIGLQLMLFMTA